MTETLGQWAGKVRAAGDDAHIILSSHESAPSRIVTLDQTRAKLQALSIRQHELFQQALLCVERGVFRAAHVMAWAGFMDSLDEKLDADGLKTVHSLRPKWARHGDLEDLRDHITEFQRLDVARDAGTLSKNDAKRLHGHLSTRNECAHPSTFDPDMNMTLGYVSGLLKAVGRLVPKELAASVGSTA
jgi:hypothetical protein